MVVTLNFVTNRNPNRINSSLVAWETFSDARNVVCDRIGLNEVSVFALSALLDNRANLTMVHRTHYMKR